MLRGSKTRFLRRHMRLLQEKQAALSFGSSRPPSRLFTAAELEEATGGYHPDNLITRDDPYELYRATIAGQAASVKRASRDSSATADHLIDSLVTEIVVLSGIGHRNVVKMLGYCLETNLPAVVYELHSHGTLQDHTFAAATAATVEPMSWPGRLSAAAEVAAGLLYLHFHAPATIVHRDVKPSNIVLDEHGVPKIVDFSLSIPIALDQAEAVPGAVAGTAYYIDPEAVCTGVVTEKSDVYSFGMLLLALLLGKHPRQWEEESGWPFLSRLGPGDGEIGASVPREELVARATGLKEAEGRVEQLWAFADLALECLRRRGAERPNMKEVERRLREIRSLMP